MSDVTGSTPDTILRPLVRRHPTTGRTGLYLTEHMSGIEGLPETEGRALLARLVKVCTDPVRVNRHHWRVGDLMIWDNRSMIQRAEGFDPRYPRGMCHVRVAGTESVLAATPQ